MVPASESCVHESALRSCQMRGHSTVKEVSRSSHLSAHASIVRHVAQSGGSQVARGVLQQLAGQPVGHRELPLLQGGQGVLVPGGPRLLLGRHHHGTHEAHRRGQRHHRALLGAQVLPDGARPAAHDLQPPDGLGDHILDSGQVVAARPRRRPLGSRGLRGGGSARTRCRCVRRHVGRGGQDEGLVAPHQLVDIGGLVPALHLHRVQPAAQEALLLGQGPVGAARAHDAHAVHLAKPLEPARQVHGIAHATELHLGEAADIPSEHPPRVQANADLKLRQAHGRKVLVQVLERELLRQSGGACLGSMVPDVLRCVPEDEETISEYLTHGALVRLYDVRHCRKVARKAEEKWARVELGELLRHACEVFDVGEHDRRTATINIQPRSPAVSMDYALHYSLGHKSREQSDASAEAVERVL
mmetsp:Transcript_76029/g.201706  ORF Transcript_76029/g.201706 Transcript_76029/m.201706 type:complete len:416 (+) Transcript_76029:719-1966(+)